MSVIKHERSRESRVQALLRGGVLRRCGKFQPLWPIDPAVNLRGREQTLPVLPEGFAYRNGAVVTDAGEKVSLAPFCLNRWLESKRTGQRFLEFAYHDFHDEWQYIILSQDALLRFPDRLNKYLSFRSKHWRKFTTALTRAYDATYLETKLHEIYDFDEELKLAGLE